MCLVGVTRRVGDPALEAAFPDERRRAEAEKWLGWLASWLPDDETLTWWRIPSLAPAEWVLRIRRVLLVAVAVVVFGATVLLTINGRDSAWWATAYGIVVCLYGYAELFHLNKIRRKRRNSSAPLASPPPVVVTPRRPRRAEFGALARSAVPLGCNIPLALVRSWTEPTAERPDLTAVGSLRADRRACVAYGLAWTPVGVLLGLRPAVARVPPPWQATVIVVLAHAAAAWLFGAVLGPRLPAAEVHRGHARARWWRGALVRLLEDTADRGLLRRVGLGYAFRDAALRASLAAGYAEEARQRTERLAAPGKRATTIANLTKPQIKRISRDVAIAVGVAVTIPSKLPGGEGWSLLSVAASLALGCVAAVIHPGGGPLAAAPARRRRPLERAAPRGHLAYGPAARRAGGRGARRGDHRHRSNGPGQAARGHPADGAGGGLRRLGVRRRVPQGARAVARRLRLVPDAVAIVAADAALVVAFDKRLLTAQPGGGTAVPGRGLGCDPATERDAALGSARREGRRAAGVLPAARRRTGAVPGLAGDVLGWSRAEVAAVLLSSTGQGPMPISRWAWTGLYAVLLAACVAFLRWPARLRKTAERFDRWQVGQATDVAGQLLTGVQDPRLWPSSWSGAAVPVTIRPVLSGRLAAAYTVAYQRELLEQGELAAYQAIIATFTGQAGAGATTTLARLVRGIHGLSSPGPGAPHATEIELRLADRLAAAQAALTALAPPGPLAPPAGTGTGGTGEPSHGSGPPQAAGPACAGCGDGRRAGRGRGRAQRAWNWSRISRPSSSPARSPSRRSVPTRSTRSFVNTCPHSSRTARSRTCSPRGWSACLAPSRRRPPKHWSNRTRRT